MNPAPLKRKIWGGWETSYTFVKEKRNVEKRGDNELQSIAVLRRFVGLVEKKRRILYVRVGRREGKVLEKEIESKRLLTKHWWVKGRGEALQRKCR